MEREIVAGEMQVPPLGRSGLGRDDRTKKNFRYENEAEGYASWLKKWMSQKVTMATAAEAGMVSTQAQTIWVATPQRTAERRWVVPTPTMAPVMVWVVLTGIPARAVPKRVMAPAVSAQKPPTGLSLVIFEPMVCTMRQPPR